MNNAKQLIEQLQEFLPVDTVDANDMSADVLSVLENIAKEFLDIPTLKTQDSDEKDFHNVSVWQLAAALNQAYILGKESVE